MKVAIAHLLDLQNIDAKLHKIEMAKGNLPEKVKKAEQELEATRAALNVKETKLNEMQKELRQIESEIARLNIDKKKFDEQLYAVTTNKEYDAVTLQIENTINKIDELENRQLVLFDAEKDASAEVDAAKEKLKEIEANFQETSVKLNETIAANAEREKELQAQRTEVSSKIKPQFLRLYERIRRPKDGIPLVTIERGACGGCYTNIPPQRIIEVREADHLILCEHCGRILYWQDEKELTIN